MNPCDAAPFNYMSNLAQWAKSNCIPLSGTFELTPFCNFQCVMCYVRLTEEQATQQGELLGAEDWIAIAKQAKEMGMLNLCLTGGEPFTHPNFWEIYSELNKMGFLITILSNGYLIDETVIEKFRKYGAPYMIKLTLYGADDETYRRTCHCKDGFTKVSRAVQLLKDAEIPLVLTATVVKENMDDLQELYRFSGKYGLPMQHTINVVKSARGVSNTAEASRLTMDNFPEELSMDTLVKLKRTNSVDPFASCASRGSSFWITWNGHVQLCAFMSKPFVSYSGDFSSDWTSLNKKLALLQSPKKCISCKWGSFCRRCPGVLCAESGDPEKAADSHCDTAKALYELYTRKSKEE